VGSYPEIKIAITNPVGKKFKLVYALCRISIKTIGGKNFTLSGYEFHKADKELTNKECKVKYGKVLTLKLRKRIENLKTKRFGLKGQRGRFLMSSYEDVM